MCHMYIAWISYSEDQQDLSLSLLSNDQKIEAVEREMETCHEQHQSSVGRSPRTGTVRRKKKPMAQPIEFQQVHITQKC